MPLIDLHCHTLPRSTCSQLHPDGLIEAARAAGLDGVCLTEHDRWWPEPDLDALRQRTGFLVLSGVELTTDLGHVLAFGLPESATSPVAADLARRAEEHGALLFLAHPARDNLLRLNRQVIDTFASVESINGSDSHLKNMAATGIARAFRLPGIAGSDATTSPRWAAPPRASSTPSRTRPPSSPRFTPAAMHRHRSPRPLSGREPAEKGLGGEDARRGPAGSSPCRHERRARSPCIPDRCPGAASAPPPA